MAPDYIQGYLYIALVVKVFVFPILQYPHDVPLIFWTCQLHTAWDFLHGNGGSERQAAWHGQLLGVVCPASAVAHARLLAAYCRHTHAKVPRQFEADMSGKSVPHHEETGKLETRRPLQPRVYI